MKNLFLTSLMLAAITSLAVATELKVSATNLAGWKVSGPTPAAGTEPDSLVLPPGSSVSRDFSGRELTVRLKSRLLVEAEAGNWPILELGSAALAFVRDGTEGGLALVLDGQPPQMLPSRFKLNDAGRTLEPVELSFSRKGGTITVAVAEEKMNFATASASEALEVVVYSGAKQPWSLDQLAVELPDAIATEHSPGSATPPTETSPALRHALTRFDGEAGALGVAKNPDADAAKASADKPAAKPASLALFGIFTPPSVRAPRTDANNHPVSASRQ